jgi:hypothetical protein
MAARARDDRVSRRRWLLAGVALPLSGALGSLAETSDLGVTWDGESLRLAAPRLHFIVGKPLARLKDGATVVFLSQVSIFTDSARMTPFRRIVDRLVVSYDLWEEKFSVTRLGFGAMSRARLTAAQVEAWSLDSLSISAGGLTPDRQFWLRFELRAADPRELSSVVGEPGISITRLIELFSRKQGGEDPNWFLEAGPMRLSELARTPARGPRTG